MFKILKKYPIIIGLTSVFLLLVGIVAYSCCQKSSINDAQIKTEAMNRKGTSAGFENPLQTVKYVLSAYREKDLDKMLRAYAIDEKTHGIRVKEILEEHREFSFDYTFPPSGNYWPYGPITKTALASDAIHEYEEVRNGVAGISNIKVESVDYIALDKQNKSEYISNMYYECEKWGASCLTEVMALLDIGGKKYMTTYTVGQYDGLWKIMKNEASLIKTSTGKPVWETDTVEYKKNKSKTSEIKEYEETWKIRKEEKNDKGTMLPLNYFISNPQREDSPEETIESFILALRKQDFVRAIGYGMTDENKEDDIEKLIDRQRDFSQQLKYLCYHLLSRERKEELIPFNESGETAKMIVDGLAPDDITYLRYVGIQEQLDIDDETKEYVALLKFRGEYILTGFTLIYGENGWQIEALKAESLEFGVGEVQ